jgi:3-methyladenine DNA glycosylase AlkC
MTEAQQLKDHLGPAAIKQLAEILRSVYPAFNQQGFETQALQQLDKRELKDRVQHIISVLAQYLPHDFAETALLLKSVSENWPEASEGNWSHFVAWPLIDYVGVYGLEKPELGLSVLEKLTPLFTAEFAIRPFLEQHFELTHQQLLRWTQHENEHVRRLASEGIRPRLPWASQLSALRDDPSPIWPIVERLKNDPSLYVRRSVANNLNDIGKDHSERLIEVCQQWLSDGDEKVAWVVKHGLRSLVKQGREEVYPLLGFSPEAKLKQATLSLSATQIQAGERLVFTLTLRTTEAQKLALDYRVGFLGKEGRRRWKVFKWKTIETQINTSLTLQKSQLFQPLSTRQLYPGLHLIECLLNGQVVARAEFQLSL